MQKTFPPARGGIKGGTRYRNDISRQPLKHSVYPEINDLGFTVVELALSLALLVLLVMMVLPGCTSGIRQAYLDEARGNLKIIQTALERYAVDHDGCYPQYILGGDISGWDTKTGCETIVARPHFADNLKQTNLKGGGARPPEDPLISGGYLESYPDNPFMKKFEEKAPTFSGGIEGHAGSGDVRFGFSGTIMGNALDDPRFLWGRYPLYAKPEDIRCQPTRLVNTISMSAWMRNFGSLHPKNEINPFYSTGGIPDSKRKNKTVRRWWPGTFFYRASGEMKLRSDYDPENYEKADTLTIWDFEVESFSRYMLGVYADRAHTGLDIIRLTTLDGAIIQNRSGIIHGVYRRSPMADYDETKQVYMSPPEVFGGGGKGIAPMFPYFDENGDFIYGAPDGHPDGILCVFIDGNRSLDEY
jgi:type II secretory pathway pseudopilin PulG